MSPWHVAPAIRILEEAREAAGQIQPYDSQGVLVQMQQEQDGVVEKVQPVDWSVIINDQVYSGQQQSGVDPGWEDDTGEYIPVVDGSNS